MIFGFRRRDEWLGRHAIRAAACPLRRFRRVECPCSRQAAGTRAVWMSPWPHARSMEISHPRWRRRAPRSMDSKRASRRGARDETSRRDPTRAPDPHRVSTPIQRWRPCPPSTDAAHHHSAVPGKRSQRCPVNTARTRRFCRRVRPRASHRRYWARAATSVASSVRSRWK